MLKINGTSDETQVKVEWDAYIPFSLRLGPPVSGSFILSCEDKKDDRVSTLEVWVHRRTRVLHDVTLVGVRAERVKILDEMDSGPTVPTKGRIPLCDVEAWMKDRAWNNPEEPAKTHIAQAVRFELVLGKNFASVRFQTAPEPKSWIVNPRSRFGVATDGTLSCIDLINLRDEDLESIRDALATCNPRD